MIRPAFVVKQIGAASVGGYEHVKRSIVINVRVSRATSNFRSIECRTHHLRYFLELPAPKIAKQVWRLGIAHALLHFFNSVFDVAVGNQNVRPAITVIIEEETAEAQRYQSSSADLRTRGLIHKQ